MDVKGVIEAMRHDHRTCEWPGETIDARPFVTRHLLVRDGEAYVTAHALKSENADAAIAEELIYFAALGQPFEWKLFSYDAPPDLLERLAKAAFSIGEPEATMIYDLQDGLEPFRDPACEVRLIDREEDLEGFRLVAEEAFGKGYTATMNALAEAIRRGEKGHVAYVASLNGQPASVGRLYTSPSSLFAGLYGGGTHPALRGRGAYRSLISARAHAAQASGARYLLVDAMPTSELILRRLGFVKVATTWPCDSPTA